MPSHANEIRPRDHEIVRQSQLAYLSNSRAPRKVHFISNHVLGTSYLSNAGDLCLSNTLMYRLTAGGYWGAGVAPELAERVYMSASAVHWENH